MILGFITVSCYQKTNIICVSTELAKCVVCCERLDPTTAGVIAIVISDHLTKQHNYK